jgi:hypothetical protein
MKTGKQYTTFSLDLKSNTFLNSLRFPEATFPSNAWKRVSKINDWVSKGIKIACKHKHDLYLNG